MRYFFSLRHLVILFTLLCSACGTALPTVKPYKLDVQQGNVVTSKMLLQLRPGMTKSQVRFIMGTPLVQDGFHGNRWDYVYQMREAGKLTEQRRVILDFENELLKSVRGDVIPAGAEGGDGAENKTDTGTRVVTPAKKPAEKGWIDKLKFWERDNPEPGHAKETKLEAAPEKVLTEKTSAKAVREQLAEQAAISQNVEESAAENKSILAVPLVMPAVDEVAATAAVETAMPEKAVASTPEQVIEVQSVPDVTPDEAATENVTIAPVSASATPPQAPAAPAPKSRYYESESGMQFDRKLTSLPIEEAVIEAPSTQAAAELKEGATKAEPSFFDRMLEKIGF
ncbi:MAG: cell envelope protein SmpA [Betaproteobacteria bacterium HGW-Betaproteobacteria-22]|nr:MAG: cell envelope protein SmpA [Betaproteobacteria bacterium HGW-Betaproteobacteria-22]